MVVPTRPDGMRLGQRHEFALLAPLGLAMVAFVVIPSLILAAYSLFDWLFSSPVGSPSLLNYQEIVESPITIKVVTTTIAIAVPVTVISVMGGYLLAYYIVFGRGRGRRLLFVLTLSALMASYLVRIYAWRILLGNSGVVNSALTGLGIIAEPLEFLIYSRTAVVIAETSLFIPLATLIFYAALSGIPGDMREAARDLGASRSMALLRVTLPLSGTAVLATTALMFFIASGDFLTPVLVGGPDSVTIGRLVADDFGPSVNYGRGAAWAVLLLLSFSILFLILRWAMRRFGLLPQRVV